MATWFKRMMPTAESVQEHRWLRWLGPGLRHPRLWRMTRRGLALGVAIGVFFGLLFPLAQFPMSAIAAVAARANLPGALVGTFVSNPVTAAPIYYTAWRLGDAILASPEPLPQVAAAAAQRATTAEDASWFGKARAQIGAIGKPLLLGLAIMASAMGVMTYLLVSWVWRIKVLLQRRRRRQRRAAGHAPA